ncbi:hypothetical protein B0H19DRAFT_990389 [Mycena capillaripes]|nr:hypothetical protein B0H19DRAFT_990389 [Mycena capillaripes]
MLSEDSSHHSDSAESSDSSDSSDSSSSALDYDNTLPVRTGTNSTINAHLEALRQSLKVQVPYTGGVHPVKADDLVIYYDVEGKKNPRRINLGAATEKHLTKLADACEKATFGVSQADVLDETYRKAGKLDLSRFASRLDVVSSGLLDIISPDMLEGQSVDSDKVLRAEIYKLNVYGPGSFFKAHRDTPRGEKRIGSLVVIFLTEHKGGELTLEHEGTTWTFDAAAKLASSGSSSTSTSSPSLAYIAFCSDVTHSVEPVLTGYRVTLTYNLFLTDRTPAVPTQNRIIPTPEREFEDALNALLADSAFLPRGGLLAYGLAHQYPIPASLAESAGNANGLEHVLYMLKGSDARIRTVSERAGLTTHVKMLYDSGEKDYAPLSGHDVLADGILDTHHIYDSGEHDTRLRDEIEKMGVVVERSEERIRELREKVKTSWRDSSEEPMDSVDEVVSVQWVTKITERNRVKSRYMAYGNDASIEHIYGNAALFVDVPAFGEGVRASIQET